MITHSVLEALEVVNSSKYKNLINLVSSPEELRNMLKNEDLHEYIVQLSANPLVTKPTSYDFVMTHIMFDKSRFAFYQLIINYVKLVSDIIINCTEY